MNKKIALIVVPLLIVASAVTAVFLLTKKETADTTTNTGQQNGSSDSTENDQSNSENKSCDRPICVTATGSSYEVVKTGEVNGWFTTGQGGSVMLPGVDFNNTVGALLFNHPSGIASDG